MAKRKITAYKAIEDIGGEFYGRNKFAKMKWLDIHRDDNRSDVQVVISAFSKLATQNSGSPCILLLTLDGAKRLHKELGKVLNPSDKELE